MASIFSAKSEGIERSVRVHNQNALRCTLARPIANRPQAACLPDMVLSARVKVCLKSQR